MIEQLDGSQAYVVKLTVQSLSGFKTSPGPMKNGVHKRDKVKDFSQSHPRVKASLSIPLQSKVAKIFLSKPITEPRRSKQAVFWKEEECEMVVFSPELINISIGLSKGLETIHLGVATFVVPLQHVENEIFDLRVQRKAPSRKRSSHSGNRIIGKRTRILQVKEFLSDKKSTLKSMFKLKPINELSKTLKFSNDPRTYGISPNAILRVKVNIIKMDLSNQIETRHMLQRNFSHAFFNSFRKFRQQLQRLQISFEKRKTSLPSANDSKIPEFSSMQKNQNQILTIPIISRRTVEIQLGKDEDFIEIVDVKDDCGNVSLTSQASQESTQMMTCDDSLSTNSSFVQRQIEKSCKQSDCQSFLMCGIMTSFDSGSVYERELDEEYPDLGERIYLNSQERLDKIINREQNDFNKCIGLYEGNNEFIEMRDASSHDSDSSVGQETFESLKNAKETLRRYADRVGMEVTELVQNTSDEDSTFGVQDINWDNPIKPYDDNTTLSSDSYN